MAKKLDLLVTKGTIITMNEERQIIKDGSVAIAKDRIVEVGKSGEMEENYEADSVIDAKGKIVRHHIDEWRKRLAPELDKQRASRRMRNRRDL